MSLKLKLILLFIAFTLVPLALFGVIIFSQARNILKTVRIAQLDTIADLKKDKIETFFQEREADIRSAEDFRNIRMNLPVLIKHTREKSAPAYVQAKQALDDQLKTFQQSSGYLDVMLLDPQGRVLYVSNDEHAAVQLNKPLQDRKFFEEGKKGIYFTDLFFGTNGHGHVEMIGIAPVQNLQGAFIGAVALEIDMVPIFKFIQDTTGLGTSGEVLIARKEGNAILFLSPLQHDPNAALKKAVSLQEKIAVPAIKAAQGENGSGITYDYHGEAVLAAWRYIPFLRWGLVTKMDASEVFAPVRQLLVLVIFVGIFIMFIGALASMAISKTVTGPILLLQRGTEIIGSGNFDHKVATRTKDEIGHLSRMIDSMTDNLKKVTASRDELNAEITERQKAEEEARSASAYARSLIEASLDPMATISVDGKIMDVNKAAEFATGASRENLIGSDFSEYFTEPDMAREGYRKVFTVGFVKDYPLAMRHVTGRITPVLYNAVVYRNEAGEVQGVFAAARDITERRRAEEIAKLDETRTNSIIKISQFPAESLGALLDFALEEAITLSRSKFGYLYFYNEDTQDFILHAWSKEVMAECTIADPQTVYHLGKTGIWGEVVRQRKPIIVNDFHEPHPLKKGYPEGHAPLSRFFSIPVFSEGRIVAVVGFANRPAEYTEQDVNQMTLMMDSVWKIVERKQAEEKLKLANAYNRSLLEASLDPLVTIDASGKITDVNLATEKVTGRTRSELIGMDFSDYFTEPEKAKAGYQQVFEEGLVMDYALEIRHKDGHSTPVLYNAAVYNDDTGKVIGVFAAARDITERKKAEDEIRKLNRELEGRVIERTAQLEASNKELEAFAYSVSHDLRTPLRGIDGFSLALLEDYADKLDEGGKDYLQRVRAGALKMGQLIDALLNLSRLTRGEVRRASVDLSSLAKNVVEELRKSEPDRRAEFTIADNVTVKGDPVMLRAAMDNLFANAWKFTGKRDMARIEFGVTRAEGKAAYFVRDNGAGFDMTYANKLFTAFQRLHGATDFPGLGIGLATVQRIIHRHGGRVWAEGEVEKGATFYFTLS
jgi:PAS domain S-box-containing protein